MTEEKDHELKKQCFEFLTNLGYECKIKYDSQNRKLKNAQLKREDHESDGAYYDIDTQTLIYLEATTKSKGLSEYAEIKLNKISQHKETIETKLGLQGRIVNRVLILVSERPNPPGRLDELKSKAEKNKIKFIFLSKVELNEYYLFLQSKIGKFLKPEFHQFLEIPINSDPIIVPALKLNLSGHPAYLFRLKVQDIVKSAYVARKERFIDGGYQRMIIDKKLDSIANFLRSGKAAAFPNSILMNLGGKVRELSNENGIIKLEFPLKSASYKIIDGQHRIYGYCKVGQIPEHAELAVVGFENILDENIERRFFVKVNDNPAKVDKALLHLLMAETDFDISEEEYWTAVAAKFGLKLEEMELFKDHIHKGHKKGKHDKITLSHLVEVVNKNKLLAHKGKGEQIKNGLLQKANEDLSIPAKTLVSCLKVIIESAPESDRNNVTKFFLSNRGFELLCKLISEFFKLNEDKLTLESFFRELRLDGQLISKFARMYGPGGAADIRRLTEEHITTNTRFKTIKLARQRLSA